MPYAYLTYAQMRQALLDRLGDSSGVFFTDAEAGYYVKEALRNWQALTGYWRDRMPSFSTVANTAFYDISAQTGSLLAPSVTVLDLLKQIQYQLIEPVGTPWTGSDQFTEQQVVQAIERRRNQFLVETGMVQTATSLAWPSPTIGRAALADTTIDVRRANWLDALTGVRSTMWRTDEFLANAVTFGWQQGPGTPLSYSMAVTPPVSIQVVPPPNANGSLEMLVVKSGATLNVSTPTVLGVPDNFAWVVKWGALADLLGQDGQGYDGMRASYCERRWKEGIELARIHTSAVQAYINGVQYPVGSVQNLDSMRPNWQDTTQSSNVGAPDALGLACWNMLGLSLVPNGVYSVQLDVVRNAPMPASDGDFIQVGREDLDAVLSCAQHIAMFKEGGYEFTNSASLYRRTIDQAMLYNERIKAAVKFFEPLSDRARDEDAKNPRREPMGNPLYQQQQEQQA